MIELTEQQSQELNSAEPIAIDPRTLETYVLIRRDVYERLKAAADDDYDPREGYPLVDQIMAEDDAHDPTLASYQERR